MRILINLENTDNIMELYVEATDTLESLKYIIEAELSIPFNTQQLKFQDRILTNDMSQIISHNILEDDIVVVCKAQPKPQMNLGNMNLSQMFDNTMKMINNQTDNSFNTRVKIECQKIKQTYLNNPGEMSILFSTDTELAEALVSENDKILEDLVGKRIKTYEDKKKKELDEYNRLMRADSMDPEAQKKIAEMIKWKNIDENLKMAHEYLPETFSHIHMLFINLEINKHKITALVDTGAQTTIISQDLAEKCGLYNLCDTRYSGIAKGVGTSKILGVIHAAQIKLGDRSDYLNIDLLCVRLQLLRIMILVSFSDWII
jgi:DNA damage-inducible protein 1